jgi:peptide/nickel transport system permease protein
MRFVILRKLVALIIVLIVVTTASFLLLELLPNSPAVTVLGPFASKPAIAKFNHLHGLDRPFLSQYWHYMTGVAHGDLGRDFFNNLPVWKTIHEDLPATIELILVSQILALAIAIPLGILSAFRPNGVIDRVSATVTFGLLAAPAFVIAVPLVLLFAVHWHFFPATGFTYITGNLGKNLRSVLLPSIVLALPSMAAYLRLLRADMIATLQEDFITMAKSKGLPTWRILLRHAFRPSTFSLVTVGGLNVGSLIGGTVIVEQIFGLPGIGRLTIISIYERNYAVVQGTVLVIAVGYVLINFLVDLLYTVIDPRVRRVGALA